MVSEGHNSCSTRLLCEVLFVLTNPARVITQLSSSPSALWASLGSLFWFMVKSCLLWFTLINFVSSSGNKQLFSINPPSSTCPASNSRRILLWGVVGDRNTTRKGMEIGWIVFAREAWTWLKIHATVRYDSQYNNDGRSKWRCFKLMQLWGKSHEYSVLMCAGCEHVWLLTVSNQHKSQAIIINLKVLQIHKNL